MNKNFNQAKGKKKVVSSYFTDYWTKQNYILLILGILVLIIGYYFMSFSPWNNVISLNISPLVLLIGYLILIPLSIFLRFNNKRNDSRNS
ncbi:MAG: hypothetical protein ACOYU5_11210 [Stygiobacter sp.]